MSLFGVLGVACVLDWDSLRLDVCDCDVKRSDIVDEDGIFHWACRRCRVW